MRWGKNGSDPASLASPFYLQEQTSSDHPGMSEKCPGCVKTCASRECAELFSPLPPFDCDCQRCSFPIQRNRDKSSTRKFDVGVFTQAGPEVDEVA